jgi:hypothetical protein
MEMCISAMEMDENLFNHGIFSLKTAQNVGLASWEMKHG